MTRNRGEQFKTGKVKKGRNHTWTKRIRSNGSSDSPQLPLLSVSFPPAPSSSLLTFSFHQKKTLFFSSLASHYLLSYSSLSKHGIFNHQHGRHLPLAATCPMQLPSMHREVPPYLNNGWKISPPGGAKQMKYKTLVFEGVYRNLKNNFWLLQN